MVDRHITVDDRPDGTRDLGVQNQDRAQPHLTTAFAVEISHVRECKASCSD
jgi:hypothetical protein